MSDEDVCYVVCKNNITSRGVDDSAGPVRLEFITSDHGSWIKDIARRFEAFHDGGVEINFLVVSANKLSEEIVNEAMGRTAIFDGYVTPPAVSGSVVEFDAWADFTPFLNESSSNLVDWSDVLIGCRQIATTEKQILMYPLDGDFLSLYYRKDVLDAFGLQVPRTWDEYNIVAQATHGKKFENKTLVGSCVGREKGCAGAYWANLLISSITQVNGDSSGALFDTQNFKFLTTNAVIDQVLQWLEKQVEFGADDEFDKCVDINLQAMTNGTCVLTYNWGDQLKQYLANGEFLKGKFGVAPTPGSNRILNRETDDLVPCDHATCKYGEKYDDIGWVNRAPYLAFGGWACAVNANTDLIAKRLAMEFCSFASSKKESIVGTAPNATGTIFNGQDPFRESQLDIDLYVRQGYEETVVRRALELVRSGLSSDNLVTDIRFPTAPILYEVLDEEFFHYLNRTKLFREYSEPERQAERLSVAFRINARWNEIIESYDARATTNRPIFEVYQRFRGVYVPDVDYNQIDGERIFGFTIAVLISLFALGFAAWTFAQRKATVVKASQPFFLIMVCIGALVFGSALFPLGIDDGIASKETCSRACMSIPWLLALGWTILFSGLFAKLRRVNIVFRNAAQFRRVTVSHRDVLQPFLLLFTGNVSVLLTWTLMDPLEWERIEISETSSYGTCSVQKDSSVWKVCFSLSIIFNFAALVLSNVEAYRARKVKVEYGESRYIGMAMASTLQLFVVGVPLLFLVTDNPSVSYFVRCFLIFGVCMAFLMFLFIPKILAWAHTKPGELVNRSGGPGLNVSMRQSFGGKSQAQMQLLSLNAKLDDLYETLKLDGINGTAYFERVGLRCRKQFGEHGLSEVPEESEEADAFVNSSGVRMGRQSYALAVTTTTASTSTYDKPESLVSEPDVPKVESNADVAGDLLHHSLEDAGKPVQHTTKRIEF